MTISRWLVALVCAAPLVGQSEADLKRFFEGKQVTVGMDMPGTQLGVDVYPTREQPLDMGHYAHRIKNYGIALRSGDTAMVTKVHVSKKNIEFQLGGGGYGTWGDSTSLPSTSSASKSSRERDLERELSRATSDSARRRIRSDLDRERSHRRRTDQYNRAITEAARIEKERLIFEKRSQGGSRFNIWYEEGRLAESVPTPSDLIKVLGEWVDFGVHAPRANPTVRGGLVGGRATVPPVVASRVQRGMSRDEVHAALGPPTSSHQGKQGDLATLIERYDSGTATTEVTYVADVVVKATSSTK